MTRLDYLLAELRCASLRARLWQTDIEAIGLALKAGWITPEQAVETLADCHCLQLIEPSSGRVPWSKSDLGQREYLGERASRRRREYRSA